MTRRAFDSRTFRAERMRTKCLIAITALVLAVVNDDAQAQNTPNDLGVPVELLEEVRNGFIFVFKDDVPATEVPGRANCCFRAVSFFPWCSPGRDLLGRLASLPRTLEEKFLWQFHAGAGGIG